MRLEPIEKPKGLMMRIAYWMTRRQLGKVMTPMKVIYPRMPCVDIARAMAIRERLGMEKFNALAEYRTSPLFSDRERAALAYAEEATRQKRVSDATFEELRKHFNEREIVEITWLNALENYYNLINIPLEIESDGFCAIALARAR